MAGLDIPAGVTVKVVQETEDTLYFVLPPNPPGGVGYNADGELSDEALATVAGGNRGIPTEPGYPSPFCAPA